MAQKAHILTGEIIGSKIKITSSKNMDAKGISGVVIDDTKNLLIIKTEKGEKKKLIKDQHTFEIEGHDEIDGSIIKGRCEERIKRWILKK